MGSSLSGSSKNYKVKTVAAEETVTPAVAQEADSTGGALSASQQEARNRLRGIRSTYTRYSDTASASTSGDTTNKLG